MRYLRAVVAFLAAAALLLAAAGAGAARPARYGGTLVVGLSSGDPDTLDPTQSGSFATGEILRTICERLYDLDAKGDVVPRLAAALPAISKDKLTYTIPLRHGIRFNDGTPFNAQAVATTIERDINLPTSTRASDFSPVDTITAPRPDTLVIHLKSRFMPHLATLATNDGVIMSSAQLSKLGTNFGSNPV